jgi:predicted HTH domain antitoxin
MSRIGFTLREQEKRNVFVQVVSFFIKGVKVAAPFCNDQVGSVDSIFNFIRAPVQQGSFVREMRLAAAVKWYEMGKVSQSKAAELTGLSRQEFLGALNRFNVSPFQVTPNELKEEIADA